ncbi:MAG: malto-oligosyltrehalose trehalohydrolase [Candidatus Omnitrophota bacterium]|nr:malto-oligosyltrehalose trehalohydrolase [Candidatus Omnitrophota bacterium]
MQFGATRGNFCVWAPRVSRMDVKILKHGGVYPMKRDAEGNFSVFVDKARPGDRYYYVIDGNRERPDPVSAFQPDGVHGPSEIVDHAAYRWSDARWKGLGLSDYIFYELHVGTFTPAGTFDAVIRKLPYLGKLGITCIELMPVAQFPGARNWGYDGVGLYAVQNTYGGPDGLRRLVDACHRQGLAVCLDVVYNHLGPEGNYLHDYGPYFTNRYHNSWGDAVNFDGADSDPVRRFFIDNALFWVTHYHIDCLRLDAVHGIYDFGATHILEELQRAVQEQAGRLRRKVVVVAESDLNDSRIIRPVKAGGFGLDTQWSDDFHHAVHVTLTGEKNGYYEDFSGLTDIVKSLRNAFVYDGRYSVSRVRTHGNSTHGIPAEKFVICTQNHDQIGNRAFGDRLSQTLTFAEQKMIAGLLLFSPYLPLLFMGEEYGEPAPFQYFVDHGDKDLVEAVRNGRKKDFEAFGWDKIPDPKSKATYDKSKLNWKLVSKGPHKHLLNFYGDMLALRKKFKIGSNRNRKQLQVECSDKTQCLAVGYREGAKSAPFAIFSFSDKPVTLKLPLGRKAFDPVIYSDETRYGGKSKNKLKCRAGEMTLAPKSAVVGSARP